MPRPRLPSQSLLEFSVPVSISFRLDQACLRSLCQRAARLGVSPHELARHYVEELLQEPEERAALRNATEQLHQNLHQFRLDFATAVEALLISAGKISAAEAAQWTEQALKPD